MEKGGKKRKKSIRGRIKTNSYTLRGGGYSVLGRRKKIILKKKKNMISGENIYP